MTRSRAGFLAVFCLLMLAAGATRPPSSPSRPTVPPPSGKSVPPQPLTGGTNLERQLASGEEHVYGIQLKAGDFLSASVDQQGIDALVLLLDPAGKVALRMDSPNSRRGEEPVCAVAERSGPYRLKITGSGGEWRGLYRLRVRDIRPASKAGRVCAAALRTLSEGDALKRGQPAQAVEKYRSALRAWTELGDAWGQVLALRRLGDLAEFQQRKRDALSHYDEALPLARSIGDRRAESHLLVRSGLMLLDLGNLSEARARSQAGLDLAEAAADLEAQAYGHADLGLTARLEGRMQQALSSYRKAEALLRRLVEPAEEARIHNNRGVLLLAVGQPEAALSAFGEALRLLRREDKADVRSAVLNGAAQAFHVLGDHRRAFLFYRKALHLASGETRAQILRRLGTVLRDDGDIPWAAMVMEESLRLSRRHRDRRAEAYALAELAHLDDLRGQEREAIRKSNQVLKILETLQEPPVVASVLFGRAEAERDLGRPDAAIASIQGSIHAVESMRSDIVDADLRMTFFADRLRYYDLYLDLLLRTGRHIEAFEASEQSRSRSLLDDMSEGPVSQAMSLREIQSEVLDEESLLLSYRLGEKRSILWAVTTDSISVFPLPRRDVIEAAAQQARTRLFEGGKGEEVETLSGMLFPAKLGRLGRKRLLIVADGGLYGVPFAALCDPAMPGGCRRNSPLILEHEVVHLPSASVVGRMRRKLANRPPAPGEIGVLADPVFQRRDERLVNRIGDPRPGEQEAEEGLELRKLQRLRLTRKEAEGILGLYSPGNRFSAHGFDASLETARSAAFLENRILHFATHNLVSDHPDLSGLVLSRFDERGRPVDGFLGAPEIYNLDLPADLVVLSACSTGLGREVKGEGLIGLTRAFLHAGARRVVVSLWDVKEGDTSDLMIRFYQGLKKGLTPPLALQTAQKSMIAEGRPSRSWAGFVLQGEPR